jgi:hypothetical protein
VLLAEYLHQEAMPGALPDEQRKLLEDFSEKAWNFYCTEKWTTATTQQLGRAWEGDTGALGWESLSKALGDDLRRPAAYVLGRRCAGVLKKPDKARELLQAALKDAPADSPLSRMAQAELDRLPPAKAPNP